MVEIRFLDIAGAINPLIYDRHPHRNDRIKPVVIRGAKTDKFN